MSESVNEKRGSTHPLNNSSTHLPHSTRTHSLTNSSTHPPSPDIAIRVEHVSKKFCRNLRKSMRYGMHDIGRNLLRMGTKPDMLRKDEFWAVDDVSFELHRGETLGIIGANGSGKSTILKMLNGIYMPDKGRIEINGRVGALIEIGAGFHPMLTGRENIYVNAAIRGMTKEEVDEKFDDIIAFADIGNFIDTPVKHYSSGMFVRLGFAVAVHCEPDILLVDEVLSVGDINFQRKSIQKMHELTKGDRAVIFVSHNIPAVLSLTQKAVYLNNGHIQITEETQKVIELYAADMNKKLYAKDKADIPVMRRGTGGARFTSVEVFNEAGEPGTKFHCGDTIRIRAGFKCEVKVTKPNFTVSIREATTRTPVTTARGNASNLPEILPREGVMECIFKNIPLRPNNYNLYLGIGDLDSDILLAYDVWDDITPRFSVSPTKIDYEEGYRDGQTDVVKFPFKFKVLNSDN